MAYNIKLEYQSITFVREFVKIDKQNGMNEKSLVRLLARVALTKREVNKKLVVGIRES